MSVSLRNPAVHELRFVLASRLLSAFANHFLLFAIPLLVFKITQDVAWSGHAYYLEWVARLASLLVAGYVIVRWGVWRPMFTSDTLRALACFATVAALAVHESVIALIALSIVNGFLFDTSFVAVETICQRRARSAHLPALQATIQAIDQSALVGAPLLASGVVAFVPASNVILFAGGCYLVSFGFLVLQHRRLAGEAVPAPAAGNYLLTGLKTIRARPRLLLLILETNAINLVFGTILVVNAAMITGVFQKSDSFFGVANFIFGVFGIACVAVTPRLMRHFGRGVGPICVVAAILCAVLAGLLAIDVNVYLVLAALVVGLDSAFSVYLRVERARAVPPALFGHIIALMMFCNALAFPISGGLVAGISVYADTPHTIAWVAAIAAALFIVSRIVALTVRQRTAATGASDAPEMETESLPVPETETRS